MAKMPKYWKRKWSNQSYWERRRQQNNIELKISNTDSGIKNNSNNLSDKKNYYLGFMFLFLIILILIIVISVSDNKINNSTEYTPPTYISTSNTMQNVSQIKISKKGWLEDRGSYISFETLAQNTNKKSGNPIFYPLLTFYNENNEPIYYACKDCKWVTCGSNGFTSSFIYINKSELPNYSYYEWRAVNKLPSKMGKQ